MKCQVDEMAIWWNCKLMKWQVGEMASWWNYKLMKLQVDEITSWKNVKMMKVQFVKIVIDDTASRRKGKSDKCHNAILISGDLVT